MQHCNVLFGALESSFQFKVIVRRHSFIGLICHIQSKDDYIIGN